MKDFNCKTIELMCDADFSHVENSFNRDVKVEDYRKFFTIEMFERWINERG